MQVTWIEIAIQNSARTWQRQVRSVYVNDQWTIVLIRDEWLCLMPTQTWIVFSNIL